MKLLVIVLVFPHTVHLCRYGLFPLSLILNPPTICSLPSRNLKPTPFARLYLNHSKVHQLYLSCDGYERLQLQCKQAATDPVFTFTNCNGKWLTRASLTKELCSALQDRGLPADRYFTLSFRLGAATTAAAADVPSWPIQVLSR